MCVRLYSELKGCGAGARAFQRVKAEEWLGDKAARDNSYHATFGSGGWGAGAQEVLGRVRITPSLQSSACLLKEVLVCSSSMCLSGKCGAAGLASLPLSGCDAHHYCIPGLLQTAADCVVIGRAPYRSSNIL